LRSQKSKVKIQKQCPIFNGKGEGSIAKNAKKAKDAKGTAEV
jgi:hypothetical protein